MLCCLANPPRHQPQHVTHTAVVRGSGSRLQGPPNLFAQRLQWHNARRRCADCPPCVTWLQYQQRRLVQVDVTHVRLDDGIHALCLNVLDADKPTALHNHLLLVSGQLLASLVNEGVRALNATTILKAVVQCQLDGQHP